MDPHSVDAGSNPAGATTFGWIVRFTATEEQFDKLAVAAESIGIHPFLLDDQEEEL